MRRIPALVVVLVGALHASSVAAQVCMRPEPDDPDEPCRVYPITDFSVSTALVDTHLDRPLDLATQLGFLVNAGDQLALGPALFVGAYRDGGWHSQIGVNARLRAYLPSGFHLDLSPGLILADSPGPDGFSGYGGELALGFRDWIALATRAEVTRRFDGPSVAWLLGLRAGSYAGLALSVAGLIGGGVGYVRSRMD